MLDRKEIRPGNRVDLVVAPNPYSDRIDVRVGKVYDVDEGLIVISQTTPPLLPSHVGKTVELTHMVTEEGKKVRYGVESELEELIASYKLNASISTEATVFRVHSEPHKYNLRMFYRLVVSDNCGISMEITNGSIKLVDISIGGAKFIQHGHELLDTGDGVKGAINLDGMAIPFTGKVVRVDHTDSNRLKPIRQAAVRFTRLDKKSEDMLARKIREVERKTRFQEMFPRDAARSYPILQGRYL